MRRFMGVFVAVALVGVGLSACLPPPPGTPTSIVTDPALFPAFQASVSDYVIRCTPGTPTAVHVATPNGTVVSVAGRYPRSGRFGELVDEQIGQSFTIQVTTDVANDVHTLHHVRCLPPDFPATSAQTSGPTQAAFFSTTLLAAPNTGLNYSAIFDTNGVPIWWLKDKSGTFMLTPLPGHHLATLQGSGLLEYDLNGQVVQSFNAGGWLTDFHEVLRLANGDYVMATATLQPCDLTSWGHGAAESCVNHVIEELQPPATPGSSPVVVFQWDTSQHISVTETGPEWHDAHPSGFFDPYHINSIEDAGDGLVVSFRHLDAVYKIDKATGAIDWKLSGSARPESLQLLNDPLGGTNGQHDARLQLDGSITIHDNGTNGAGPSRQPRVVRYAIDTVNHTATLVQQFEDSAVTFSQCCGSARRLPGGDWVVGWGGTPLITENRPDGSEVFRLTGTFVYRGVPIMPGDFTASEFRDGMDAQYGFATTSNG